MVSVEAIVLSVAKQVPLTVFSDWGNGQLVTDVPLSFFCFACVIEVEVPSVK